MLVSTARASCDSTMTGTSRCGRSRYAASSTRLRSMRISRTSSGVARISTLVISALTHTLLPLAGCAGDQQVRHARQVDRVALAAHVAPEGEHQLRRPRRSCPRPRAAAGSRRSRCCGWGSRCRRRRGPGSAPRCGSSARRAPSRDRPRAPRCRLSLTRASGLHLVLRHHRAGVRRRNGRRDLERRQLLLDDPDVAGVVKARADRGRLGHREQLVGRAAPRRVPGSSSASSSRSATATPAAARAAAILRDARSTRPSAGRSTPSGSTAAPAGLRAPEIGTGLAVADNAAGSRPQRACPDRSAAAPAHRRPAGPSRASAAPTASARAGMAIAPASLLPPPATGRQQAAQRDVEHQDQPADQQPDKHHEGADRREQVAQA